MKSLAGVALCCVVTASHAAACYPKVNPNYTQVIVGYGSLMNALSKNQTDQTTGPSLPVEVSGFRRVWTVLSPELQPLTSYLGVYPQKNNIINAVAFSLPQPEQVYLFDKRELAYCRQVLSPTQVRLMVNKPINKAQYWIYTPKAKFLKSRNERSSISQAYVDVFLSGCISLEVAYGLPGFSDQCVATTGGWQEKWIEDRAYSKRYYIQAIDERNVNQLIQSTLPKLYKRIEVTEAKDNQ